MPKEKKKMPRRNQNAHANCKNSPCPYCLSLEKSLMFMDPPDSDSERFERGLPRGHYGG